jgi:uncharacterized protein (DUF4415 family)
MKKGNPEPLPKHLADELAVLETMPDEAIDTREMPAVPDWSDAVRGRFYRPAKRQLTLRIDADVIEYFQRQAPGGAYQTMMNRALRAAMLRGLRRRAPSKHGTGRHIKHPSPG